MQSCSDLSTEVSTCGSEHTEAVCALASCACRTCLAASPLPVLLPLLGLQCLRYHCHLLYLNAFIRSDSVPQTSARNPQEVQCFLSCR